MEECLASTAHIRINALPCACVYIYIRRFIDLTVATCHIQYTFLSLCNVFLPRENGQNTKILEVRHFRTIRKWPPMVLGAQSINTERTSVMST